MKMMKAAVCNRYGPPEVLQIKDIEQPLCRDHEIRVKVMAAAVNSGDARVRALAVTGALKIVMRLVLGFFKPRRPVMGVVFSGIVETVGSKVTQFRTGDKVFGCTGFRFGAYAEYLSVPEDSIVAKMPVNASFAAAAALPFGWHTAIHFLGKAGIAQRSNPNVLIYGATGSVGVAAVQLAKYYNATVTAVCSSEGEKLVKELEVDKAIFYDQEDFVRTDQKFDIVFDAAGKTSRRICKPLLRKGGRFVTVGGLEMAAEKVSHLHFICNLFERGRCRPVVDKVYPFQHIVEAHRYVDTGRKKGNVVITIGNEYVTGADIPTGSIATDHQSFFK